MLGNERKPGMDPTAPEQRRVADVLSGVFVPLLGGSGREDGRVPQVIPRRKLEYGFHVYRMEADYTTASHTRPDT